MSPPKLDREYPLLPLNKSMVQKPTIDARVRDALKPVVSDINVLQPDQFSHLCQETHGALQKRLNANEDSAEIRSALSDLVKLLEENIALQTTLEAYMNRVKKV